MVAVAGRHVVAITAYTWESKSKEVLRSIFCGQFISSSATRNLGSRQGLTRTNSTNIQQEFGGGQPEVIIAPVC
jgi:hypothetical protein